MSQKWLTQVTHSLLKSPGNSPAIKKQLFHNTYSNFILGPGLVFQTFPTVLSLLPWPQFWTALFFFMLILIGLDSQVRFPGILTEARQTPKSPLSNSL